MYCGHSQESPGRTKILKYGLSLRQDQIAKLTTFIIPGVPKMLKLLTKYRTKGFCLIVHMFSYFDRKHFELNSGIKFYINLSNIKRDTIKAAVPKIFIQHSSSSLISRRQHFYFRNNEIGSS